MELVYLWVEDYKNIKNQGFNFSPRFRCEYDKDKNELIIEENEDYIPDFFGENINVTAIVGKNGSGKSSIVKLVFLLIFFKKFIDTQDGDIFDSLKGILESIGNKELFLIVKEKNEFKKISFLDMAPRNIYINSKDLKKCKIELQNLDKEFSFFNIHFNFMLDTLVDNREKDEWIKKIYHKADDYDTPLLLEPYKNTNNSQIINMDTLQYLTNQKILFFYNKLEHIIISSFFSPNKVRFVINREKLANRISRILDLNKNNVLKEIELLIDKKDLYSLNI